MGTSLLPSAGCIPVLMGPGRLCPWGQETSAPFNQRSSAQSHPKNIALKHKSTFQRTISPFYPMLSAGSCKINRIIGFFSM